MSDYPDTLGRKRSYTARVQAAKAKKAKERRRMGKIRSYDGGNYKPKQCRFISNDDMRDPDWCNAPVKEGGSYCPEHHARCYLPPRKKLQDRTNYSKQLSRFR